MKKLNTDAIKKNLIRNKIICEKSTKVEEPRLGFARTIDCTIEYINNKATKIRFSKTIILCDSTIVLRVNKFTQAPILSSQESLIIDLDDFDEYGSLNEDLLEKAIFIGLDELTNRFLDKDKIPKACESDTFYMYDDESILKRSLSIVTEKDIDNFIIPSKVDDRHLYESDSFTISDIVKSITL